MTKENQKKLGETLQVLRTLQDDEQADYDRLPVEAKDGDRGTTLEDNIEHIENAIDELEQVEE